MTETTRRHVLEETPSRALSLLRGVGASISIRAAMNAAGYTDADHAEGWRRNPV